MPGSTPPTSQLELAHLDDGNDRAILVQGHEGPAQIVRLGHRGTPSIDVSDEIAILAARPIASPPSSRESCKTLVPRQRGSPSSAGDGAGLFSPTPGSRLRPDGCRIR